MSKSEPHWIEEIEFKISEQKLILRSRNLNMILIDLLLAEDMEDEHLIMKSIIFLIAVWNDTYQSI